ncbi:hypothetical protein B0T24DRAFT_686932 [Lasiosphaeria ovina]|uniref:Uncharacterized protein n=1 Tax=Lasiosphaeria ovina TaxID=92902 RepID=A0AAE0NJM2_9PEZI|nr:hypothetical protein B0T24DRAFT_686932 [Lasiosphaeria ovina]
MGGELEWLVPLDLLNKTTIFDLLSPDPPTSDEAPVEKETITAEDMQNTDQGTPGSEENSLASENGNSVHDDHQQVAIAALPLPPTSRPRYSVVFSLAHRQSVIPAVMCPRLRFQRILETGDIDDDTITPGAGGDTTPKDSIWMAAGLVVNAFQMLESYRVTNITYEANLKALLGANLHDCWVFGGRTVEKAAGTQKAWSPFYLQRRTIYASLATFLAIAVTLEAMFIVSEKNEGLASSSSDLRYLWTYGPTVMTISILFVPFQAARNRDALVAGTSFVTLLLTVMAAFSSSLFQLTTAEIVVSLTSLAEFVDDASNLTAAGLLPLYMMIGTQRYNLDYPNGISQEFVYQITAPSSTAPVLELRATAEGLSAGLECDPAVLTEFRISGRAIANTSNLSLSSWDASLTLGLTSPQCDMTVYGVNIEDPRGPVTTRVTMGNFRNDSLHPDNRRLAWVVAEVSINESDVHTPGPASVDMSNVLKSQQLICKPSFAINDVDIVALNNERTLQISLARGPPRTRTLLNVHAWDFAEAMVNAHEVSHGVDSYDRLSKVVFGLGRNSYPDLASIFNYTSLASSMQNYYSAYTLFLAHSALLRPTSQISSCPCYATVAQSLLTVSPVICQVLAGMCLLTFLVLALATLGLPRHFSLAGDPRTILGFIVLAKDIARHFQRQLGALETKASGLEDRVSSIVALLEILLRYSEHNDGIGAQINASYLWTLSPTLGLGLVGLFFPAVNSELRNIAPFSALGKGPTTFSRSVDLNLRGLLIPQVLYREVKARDFVAATTTATAIFAGLLTLASGSLFFPKDATPELQGRVRLVGLFSSSMDTANPLDPLYWFYAKEPGDDDHDPGVVSALALQAHIPYPAFTSGGLAFPALALTSNSTGDGARETEIRATVPALRSRLDCFHHPQVDMFADILHVNASQGPSDYTIALGFEAGNVIRVNVTGEFCPHDTFLHSSVSPELMTTAVFTQPGGGGGGGGISTPEGTFAAAGISSDNVHAFPCSAYFYVWGNYSRSAGNNNNTVSASAISCNAAVETVDVDAVFLGAELAVSPDTPPQPREGQGSSHYVNTLVDNWHGYSVYLSLMPITAPTAEVKKGPTGASPAMILDDFFTILTSSPQNSINPSNNNNKTLGLALSALSDRAQAQTRRARIPSDETQNDTGIFDRFGQGALDNLTTYAATMTHSGPPRRRVVQDLRATRVIQALLAATLAAALLSWWLALLRRRRAAMALPRSLTTVASVLALLVDGNVYRVLEQQREREKGVVGGFKEGNTGIVSCEQHVRAVLANPGFAFQLGIGVRLAGAGVGAGGDNAGSDSVPPAGTVVTEAERRRFAIWVVGLKRGE